MTRFADAPKGFGPYDIYPDYRSVVVFASPFPLSTLQAKTNTPYTLVRNKMVDKVDWISSNASSELETESVVSLPIPSAEPYDYGHAGRTHGRGIMSLKHAAVLAGLGVLGKNTLLMNETFGNMLWLGAVPVSIDSEPQPLGFFLSFSHAAALHSIPTRAS